jgi:hypothetical protein
MESILGSREASQANELGYRGHRANGPVDHTVVLLGDSQAESVGAFSDMPEVFLTEELLALGRKVRTVTIASAGWGQDQEFLALQADIGRIAPPPSVVALWLTPGNDFWNNTFPVHFDRSKPTFWLEQGRLAGPNVDWLGRCNRHSLYLVRAIENAVDSAPCVTDAQWERKLPPPYASLPEGPERATDFLDLLTQIRGVSRAEAAEQIKREQFKTEKNHFAIGFTPQSQRLAYSKELTHQLLLAIQRVSAEHGAKLIVFTYENLGRYYPDRATRVAYRGMIFELSRQTAENVISDAVAGIPFLAIPMKGDYSISRVDSHLNGEGNHVVMAALARRLVDSGALEP